MPSPLATPARMKPLDPSSFAFACRIDTTWKVRGSRRSETCFGFFALVVKTVPVLNTCTSPDSHPPAENGCVHYTLHTRKNAK
jgi:hypothetical protein